MRGTDAVQFGQLVNLLVSERNHAEHYTDAFRVRQSKQLIKALEKQITQCDEAITTLIAQDTELAHKAEQLKAISGVGPVLAEMPELGKLTTQPPPPSPASPLTTATAAARRASGASTADGRRCGAPSTWPL